MNYDYSHVLSAVEKSMSSYSATGSSGNFMVGRLSYHLALTGPAASIDTACSSSLVAAHLSRNSILQGEINDSIAGGVNLMLSPAIAMALCRLNALSPEGRCRALDSLANGYGRSEAVLLMILSHEDGITGGTSAIVSSSVNQDGQSSSLTSPCGPSQSRLILGAAEQGRLPLSKIGTYSLHGTGTSLGDPIEFNALMKVFSGKCKDGLSIGAFKSILGHTEGAAGLCGLLQISVSLQDSYSPLIKHLITPNNFVAQTIEGNSKHGPVLLPRQGVSLPLASFGQTSSFGMSGTNASSIVKKRDGENHQSQYEFKNRYFRTKNLWPGTILKHYCGRARCPQSRVTFEVDLRRVESVRTHADSILISSAIGLCFSLTDLVCESRHANYITLECQNQSIAISWPFVSISLMLSDGSLTMSSSGQKMFDFKIELSQTVEHIVGEPRRKVFDFHTFPTSDICTATIQHDGGNLTSTAIQSLIELRLVLNHREDTGFDHMAVRGARDEHLDGKTHTNCVCYQSGGRTLETAITLDISGHLFKQPTANGVQNELMTQQWKPINLMENDLAHIEPGKICFFMLGDFPGAKSQIEAFGDCLRIGMGAPGKAHTFELSLSSIEHLVCILRHSDIAHLLLANDYSDNAVKYEHGTDVVMSIYDMMALLDWKRSLTVSPLSIVADHIYEPHRTTIKQYEATLSLSKTLFLESRQSFAPAIKLVSAEGLARTPSLETLKHLLTCTGEYEFLLQGQRCHVLRIKNGRYQPRHAPKVPSSILVYGGSKVRTNCYTHWC